jgi:hypothetical protein
VKFQPAAALAAAAAALFLALAADAGAQTAARPPCVLIPVDLSDTVDSAKAHPGDVFRFRTIDAILAPGGVTIPRDAVGYGMVTAASPAGAHGKAGSLVVEARYVDLGAGRQYQVAIDTVASAAAQNGSTGNAPGSVSALPIPFMGAAAGAYNYFHAGKNVAIKPGFRFVVVPVRDLARPDRCAF